MILTKIKQLYLNHDFSNENTQQIIKKITELLEKQKINESDKKILLSFLKYTANPQFLTALNSEENRTKWANSTFKIIRKTNFNLHDIFLQKLEEHPKKVLFLEKTQNNYRKWTYQQIYALAKETAAFFYKIKPKDPKVLIFMENSINAAVIDIACLMFGIFDTPLNVHFNPDNLSIVMKQINFDFVVTDNLDRLKTIEQALKISDKKINIVVTKQQLQKINPANYFLSKERKKITTAEGDKILSHRPRREINKVATAMFTSGSTGKPKGVSFSIYNIISKRFARAAALPQVGNNEVFVCYLPLFHTFGRFLEMTGTIFWGGTYVMANNPSFETLANIFPQVNPTGFISVPVRWVQFYEKIINELTGKENDDQIKEKIKKIVGKNLHWGLSAAGYLDPKIFKFFQKYGITLNSGFGMTEATGGITMTPSFVYVENSVGKPLPGMTTRLAKNNELEFKSHYLARYLKQAKPYDTIKYPEQDNYWLKTGDIFIINKNGHHQIIDRVKDIYKNNKGQTVSPRTAEAKFDRVPGIKRTFLVGDARPYNVLLIVPNEKDPILKAFKNDHNRHEYFKQIVIAANADLPPYERVVNFEIIDRDFSIKMNEITQKGSYKRKNIEKNFANIIKNLYKAEHISFEIDGYNIIIPRWLIRDWGIIETDITLIKNEIVNTRTKKKLRVKKCSKKNFFVVGDLSYLVKNKTIDIGRIIRQPRLWVGNPQITNFAPCKANYDLPLKNFSPQICIPKKRKLYLHSAFKNVKGINDHNLVFLNNLMATILHTDTKTAIESLLQLEDLIPQYEINKAEIIKQRLEALSCHNAEEIRITAYQILITMTPHSDFSKIMPSFINSGKTFLNQKSIEKIAQSGINSLKITALRKRLLAYRRTLKWPANKITVEQFEKIFDLLFNFGMQNIKYYKALRAEFASWQLFKIEPNLAKKAEKYFIRLHNEFEKKIAENTKKIRIDTWRKLFVFDEGISQETQETLIVKLKKNNFLKLSVLLAYDDFDFEYKNLTPECIRISRLKNYRNSIHYRMSINSNCGKHFDIHISIDNNISDPQRLEMILKHIVLSGFPAKNRSIAQFGYAVPSQNIYTTRYISQLSAWDKIRSMAEIQKNGYLKDKNFWRKIFIRSMAVFFNVWYRSDKNITPGFVSPENVVVPEIDFSENVQLLSLSASRKLNNIKDLFIALYLNFYTKTVAHYPALKNYLNITWLFHASIEGLGKNVAEKILIELIDELNNKNQLSDNEKFIKKTTTEYLTKLKEKHYLPLSLFNAIDRYSDWINRNEKANATAQIQTIDELIELYKLNDQPEIVRYKFFKNTYFANASNEIVEAFDNLLNKMFNDPEVIAIQLTELSDLQTVMTTEEDKIIFNKLVFPDLKERRKIDFRKIGEKKSEHLIVSSKITDKKKAEYTMREPIDASEVGAVYKIFFKENYPKEISQMDKHYVVLDKSEQVVAGLCYKELENNIVLIDGMAVTTSLQGKGIGSKMMSDFFDRMKAKGVKFIKAHFLFGNYYLKHNFKIDKKWGALIRKL